MTRKGLEQKQAYKVPLLYRFELHYIPNNILDSSCKQQI